MRAGIINPKTPDILDTVFSVLLLVWLVVAIALFVRKITIYQSFARYIKAGRTEVDDIKELERFGKIVEQEKIRVPVGLYTNSLISSPLLMGFFRPYIVLPTLEINDTDFKNIIVHEITHLKRGDMFYKWFVQLVICLHWFNPLVYLMGREINNACEFSCDEAVAKNLNTDQITAYGNTLLNSLGRGSYKSSVSAVTLNENKKILMGRLASLKKIKKNSLARRGVEFVLCIVVFAGAVACGAYSGIPAENESSHEFGNPTLPTPVLELRIIEEDGSTNIRWETIEGAHDHIIYLDGVSTGISMSAGGGGTAAFTVEFLMAQTGRFHLPIVPGVNTIQVRAIGDGGNIYSALSEPVIYIYE
jgi:beta-lactamase regulating signal transducer with metallopeptidase domain